MNTPEPKSKRFSWRFIWLGLSLLLFVFVTICNWWQPDALTPVTLVPPWCWLVGGVILLLLGRSPLHRRVTVAVFLCWCVFGGVFVEQFRSSLRSNPHTEAQWQQLRAEGRAIRVVSLNCGSYRTKAIREVAAVKPDVVLLQESPSFGDVLSFSKELFGEDGGMFHGGDTSIIAAGKVERHRDQYGHFTWAKVATPTGDELDVVSARLAPPVFRLDVLTRGFWRDHRQKRQKHRDEVLAILETLGDVASMEHLIIGGDLNSPANDGALQPLKKSLRDSFRVAGRGWGCTGTNDYPLFRVDQIWTSKHLRSVSVYARKTEHSDHRMVVCDLLIE